VSSDFCGAQPRPHSVRQSHAGAREKWALTEHRPPRFSIGASAPRSWYIGGTTAVSSDSRGAKPRPIPIKRVRACARKTTALTEQRPPWRSVRCHQINAFISPWYGQSAALVTKLARTGFSTTYRHLSS